MNNFKYLKEEIVGIITVNRIFPPVKIRLYILGLNLYHLIA